MTLWDTCCIKGNKNKNTFWEAHVKQNISVNAAWKSFCSLAVQRTREEHKLRCCTVNQTQPKKTKVYNEPFLYMAMKPGTWAIKKN